MTRHITRIVIGTAVALGVILYAVYEGNRRGGKVVVPPAATKASMLCKDPSGSSYSEGALIRGADDKILRCVGGEWLRNE